ncbi:MAG: dihydrolipoamide acetyltransferase family protein [Candidatus Nanoarchaeia archaeon]
MEFKFPDVGEGITEGKLLKWLVKKGDTVKEDQILAEVETDKAVVEVPSPYSGKINKLHAKANDVIKVGEVLVTFEGVEAQKEEKKEEHKEKPKEPPKEEPKPAPAPKPAPEQKAEPVPKAAPEPPKPAPKAAVSKRVLATPHTRRLARELGIDINTIQGSGPAGRITDADLKGGAKAPTAPEPAVTPAPTKERPPTTIEGAKREAMTPVRKAIAAKMTQSKEHAVHVTHCDEVDVTFLVRIRNKQKEHARKQGVKLTYLPFIAKAAMAAIRKFPQFNASLDEAKNELVFHDHIDLGMALATDFGLIVPVIRDAEKKSILDLGREMHELADRGRTRRLKPEVLKGSTFTITNVGSIGGTVFTPIINYPEAAILGVGRIQELPRINNGKVEPRHILYLSLSFDHRIADGAEAAKFMNEIKAHLEDPSLMLVDVI